MPTKFAQGIYDVQNPSKYVGKKPPYYRSSWEAAFCRFCDDNPSILKWASENIKIPYQNPLTGKYTNYVPDFMIQYVDKNGREHVELIEIKPGSQTTLEGAGRSKRNQAAVAVNTAKWQAASEWCKQQGIHFRVVNEDQIFKTNKKRNKRARNPKSKP